MFGQSILVPAIFPKEIEEVSKILMGPNISLQPSCPYIFISVMLSSSTGRLSWLKSVSTGRPFWLRLVIAHISCKCVRSLSETPLFVLQEISISAKYKKGKRDFIVLILIVHKVKVFDLKLSVSILRVIKLGLRYFSICCSNPLKIKK